MKQESLQQARQSLAIERDEIQNVLDTLDPAAFGRAVDVLARVPRIMTCASGTSGIAAKKFAHSLCCIERGAMFMPPCEAVHGGLGALKREDALVMVSRGGKTAELLPIIDVCRKGARRSSPDRNSTPRWHGRRTSCWRHIGRRATSTTSWPHRAHATVALFDLCWPRLSRDRLRTEMFALIHPAAPSVTAKQGAGTS